MDQNNETKFDVEFKRYLQILRPYLCQLIDQDVIDICNAWIQKLSNCEENEKVLRNKYVFALCYQVAKGVLEEPFVKPPPLNELPPLRDDASSDESFTEVECLVIDSESANTKILCDKQMPSKTVTDKSVCDFNKETSCDSKIDINISQKYTMNQSKYESMSQPCNYTFSNDNFNKCEESYYLRANNLITKVREIKDQNVFLHNELKFLKQECKPKEDTNDSLDDSILKEDNATIAYNNNQDNNTILLLLKSKLKEAQCSRNKLILVVESLQENLDNFEESKNHEIEELKANHKLEIIKLRTGIREELKVSYERKLDALRKEYDNIILETQRNTKEETDNLNKFNEQIIVEKEQILQNKEDEIRHLKRTHEEMKSQQYFVLNKFIDSSNENSTESVKIRSHNLEKRLYKMEKSKEKCVKAYEAKIATLQREKHVAECSLQLQLIKQRAQIVNEVTDENQTEITSAIDKLENKYKEIVANMQATAMQRRLQDQIALESLMQAVCGNRNENTYTNATNTNVTHYPDKNIRNQSKDKTHTRAREIETLRNRVDNVLVGDKSFGEDSVVTGYCLDSEKLQELFERVQIPQRDVTNIPN